MQVPNPMADEKRAQTTHPDDDWKVWTVINPATWTIPFFGILFVQMWLIHSYALALPGYGWKDSVRVDQRTDLVEETAEIIDDTVEMLDPDQ